MKADYANLKNHLEKGEDVQTYTFSQIEEIIGTSISPVYLNRRAFKRSNSRFQQHAKAAGFLLTAADYENQTLTFTKNDGRIVPQPVRSSSHHGTHRPVRAMISQQALDPNDIGKDLQSAIEHFKRNWRTTGTKSAYIPFRNKYTKLEDVYYHAGNQAYQASVKNRIPLFEGISNRVRATLREESVVYLADQLALLFKQKKMDFDKFAKWEYKVATHIREIYHNGGVRLYTYGNAQKIINVALKFVLSSDIVDYRHQVFKYCFLPIDGRIQQILKSQLAVGFLHKNGRPTYYQPSWARCDNWNDLLDYQVRAREAIMNHGYYSPIVWEATHWN